MSLHEYKQSIELYDKDYPFYALIMAAMRKADSDNERLLRDAFPRVWDELQARYDAPGGVLPVTWVVTMKPDACQIFQDDDYIGVADGTIERYPNRSTTVLNRVLVYGHRSLPDYIVIMGPDGDVITQGYPNPNDDLGAYSEEGGKGTGSTVWENIEITPRWTER